MPDQDPQLKLANGEEGIAESPATRKLLELVKRIAQHSAAVLITGETGSGKEMIARAVHAHSLRCNQPFIDVNCASIPEHLVESELFGYEKGAFSGADSQKPGLFELAGNGTLFLDEIGELDPKVQVKLLRVLDGVPYYRLGGTKKVATNARIVAATNVDLATFARQGKFRSDLYHRLSQFRLQVPALRERPEDAVAIARSVLQKLFPGSEFRPDALELIRRHSWPGNIRELKNAVFAAAMHASHPELHITGAELEAQLQHEPASLPEIQTTARIQMAAGGNAPNEPPAPTETSTRTVEQLERATILDVLQRKKGNRSHAAEELGISRRTLIRKLKLYNGDSVPLPSFADSQDYRTIRLAIETTVTVDAAEGSLTAQTTNLSATGMGLSPLPGLTAGDCVRVTLSLPRSTKVLALHASVVWSSASGCGLVFVDVAPATARELERWVLEQLQKSRSLPETGRLALQ